MAKSKRETKKLSDALKKSSKEEGRKDRGMQSEHLQAEYIEPGSQPHLSNIQILGETHTDIPKLREVGAEETFVKDQSGAGVTSFDIPGPYHHYDTLKIRITGEINTNDTDVLMRVNGVSSTSYRWFQWWHDGTNTGDKTGTFHTAHWAASVRNTLEITVLRPHTDGFAIHGIGYDSDPSNPIVTVFGGEPAPAGDFSPYIETLTFLAGGGAPFTFYQITISGERPLQPGDQLLCLRTKLIPLTIIGVLDGRTIEES